MWKRATLVAAAGLAVMASGCAEEREPINQVQPDVLDKSFFVGKNLMDSSDDPEFYAQGTLIDVGYGAAQNGLFTSTYAQPLSRIRWVIQEDKLVARLAYERIEGTDGKGVGPLKSEGIIVAVYPIEKHFDIQKQYNPTTGEELNVVVENSTDRPWYERQYFRVNWAKNENVDSYDFDTLSQIGVFGGVKYEPLAYYINDPRHPDAPHFDVENGYFDVTNKAFAKPGTIDFPQWGIYGFPSCFLPADVGGGSEPVGSCNPVELTIRQSFRRVDSTDYEPADWDGYRFQAFGAFLVERRGYARNYGMTDDRWYRFITRYNLWERSHYYDNSAAMTGEVACYTPTTTPAGKDPNRDEDGNGTADECELVTEKLGIGGSQCDHFNQKCTLPYRARTEKPIAWYYTKDSNLDYFDSTEWATHEWDVALRSSIMAARYTECKKTGDANCEQTYPMYSGQQDDNADAIWLAREVDACRLGRSHQGQNCDALADRLAEERGFNAGVRAIADMDEMLVLCHSPVEAGDPAACGGPRLPAGLTAAACAEASAMGEVIPACDKALSVRKGDLRYHQVNVIKEPQSPSPWGIYTDAEDPLTGETISASINVWSHVTDLASQGIIDTSRYIKGELTTEQITEGEYIHQWSQAAQAATRGSLPRMTSEQVDEAIASFVKLPVEQYRTLRASRENLPGYIAKDIAAHRSDMQSFRWDAKAPSTNRMTYETRRQNALGSVVEAELTTKMMQEFAGTSSLPGGETQFNYASPLRSANPTMMREIRRARELALAERGTCVLNEAPAPISAVDLADVLEAKFGSFNAGQGLGEQLERAEKMRKYVAERMHYNVVLHEMGHSIGLRHNFVSSSDAFNYRPQYWQLRTDNGTNNNICTGLDPEGACVGPRYWDPINQDERDNLLQMFMQSSVMDYAGELSQDFIGLGAYDFAATRMFYGDVVSVFADDSFKVGGNRAVGVLEKMDNFGGTVGFRPSIGGGRDPYENNEVRANVSINFHYSQLQQHYDLITDCAPVNPELFKPSDWDEDRHGTWHPVIDGLIVPVNGEYSRCKQQPVDYVHFSSLRQTVSSDQNSDKDEYEVVYDRRGYGIDPQGRTRVPYGFATDRWADLGNVSVYRHDNGADVYELFDFLITQQEVGHIFDNYRRGRSTFSVRGAAGRTLGRFNEKIRDGAKGLGIVLTNVRERGAGLGIDPETYWALISADYQDNILAAQIAFDHFARNLARPQAGHHGVELVSAFQGIPVSSMLLRSNDEAVATVSNPLVTIPNGATGLYGNVGFGGKLIENRLAENKGEYDAEFTINAGSYYDKAYAAMLFTESEDNFISDSRRDFFDPRYRAVSLADLFPDGYRRLLANNLTGDEFIKAPRLVGEVNPLRGPVIETDAEGFPKHGLGWVQWWPKDGPEVCFPESASMLCSADVTNTFPVDPQVGWEQQKFLIAFTMLYLPENQKQQWLNHMWLWELGADNDPGFENRIEFHDPHGRIYVAKTFGKETLFGKTVQKGVAARVLEYANDLVKKAYVTTDGPDLDGDGAPDWFVPQLNANGQPVVQYDPNMATIVEDEIGRWVRGPPREGCNENENWGCVCESNKACIELEGYASVPAFLRSTIGAYGMGHPSMRGIY